MKRFHVHLAVDDLDANIRFYSTLFGTEPTVRKPDYAKWMLDDPRLNFAISARGAAVGVNHLGVQADDDGELAELETRARHADANAIEERSATCCYAAGNKYWATDPQGIAWEHFHTLGDIPVFGSAAVGIVCTPGKPCG